MSNKKRVPAEAFYLLGLFGMPLAISLMTKADMGLSMIAAPTFIISERLSFLTYGQTEYIAQGLMLLLMCTVVRKFKPIYFTSYITAVIYGTVLDFFIRCFSGFTVDALWLRIVLFVIGMALTSFGVACFMNTYLPPCAWDYFVRTVVEEKKLDLRKFKLGYDFCFLLISVALTLILFGRFIGVTPGTLVIAVCNGNLIAIINNYIRKHFEVYAAIPKLKKHF